MALPPGEAVRAIGAVRSQPLGGGSMPPPHPPGSASKPLKKPGAKPPKRKALAAATVPGNPYAQQAQQEVDPIIAALTAQYEGQANNSDAAIQQLTAQYAKDLGGINYGQPYQGAETQQAAIDAALQQSATNQGSSLASSLQQSLQALQGSSGQGAVDQAAAQLAQQGRGIGTAQLASGSAELGNLVANQAAAQSYGQKMPGIAKLAGLQGIEQAQGQAQQGIQNATTQIEGELPAIEQNLQANVLTAKQNRLANQMKMASLKSTNAYRGAEIGLRQQALASTNQYHQAQIGLRQQSLAQGQQRLQIEAQRAASSNSQAWARIGIENQRLKIEAAKAALSAHAGGLTPAAKSRYTAEAGSWAQRMLGTTTDPNTMVKNANGQYVPKQLPRLSFTDAMKEAMGHGVPLSLAFPIFLKVAKQAGASKADIKSLQKEYAPLDAALRKQAQSMRPLPGTSGVVGSLAFAGEKGLSTPAQRKIVGLAHEYMGTPYVWGGESPKGFDCSGFAQYLYGKAGISIPRTTYTQWTAGHAVSQSALRPGDLVFFKGSDSVGGLPGHVGIYIGGGKMIDAPHTGSDVRIDAVGTFGGYMGARRYGSG